MTVTCSMAFNRDNHLNKTVVHFLVIMEHVQFFDYFTFPANSTFCESAY